jgi:hypothetical protein
MRRRIRSLFVSILFCIALADPSSAALLTLSGSSLTIKVAALDPLTFFQDSAVLVPVASANGGFTEPAGVFTGTAMLPTGCPGVCLTNGFTVANLSNLTKTIAPGALGGGQATGIVRPGGGMGGPGPLLGDAIINVLGLFNLVIPLDVVGSTGADAMVVAGTLVVSAFGTGWTTGAVTITGITTFVATTPFGYNGMNVNTVTFGALGFDNRTPGHNGVIGLVSPFKVVTNAAGNFPGYALQTLVFSGGVPEPGTLVLLGTAVAALALRGLAMQRRSRRR